MSISEWLRQATKQLKLAGIDSARLDAEILMAHTLNKSRTYLHAHTDDNLDDRQLEIADARLSLRLDRTPIAYIIGHKEFYGRIFSVSPAVLIPRPESEVMISLLLAYTSDEITPKNLIDIGTGSGCLGITAKLERPHLRVTLADISLPALNTAKTNVDRLEASIQTIKSNLLSNYPVKPDYILANLPYVDKSWDRSLETNFEPSLALFSDDGGLGLTKDLLEQSIDRLNDDGLIFIETDLKQHPELIDFAKKTGFSHLKTDGFITVFQK